MVSILSQMHTEVSETANSLTLESADTMGEDHSSYGSLFGSTLLLVILLGFFFRTTRKNKRFPPSPPAFPIIGHLHLLGENPHRSLNEFAKKYGPIMLLRFGAHPTVVASTPDMAKEFLKIQDSRFASRASFLGSRILLYNDQAITFTEYGQHWKLMRKFLMTELLTPKRLVETQQIRREELLSMVGAITDLSRQGKEINVSDMIYDCAMNIVGRIVIGKRIVQGAPFSKLLLELMSLLEEVNISDFIPLLGWLDLKGYEKRANSLRDKLEPFLADIILQHRQRRPSDQTGYIPDFVDALLDSSIDGIKLQEDQIKVTILEAFLGATQTTSATLEWALSELLHAPSALHKAQEELDQIVGTHGVVEESCLEHLKYLKAILKETLRLHPPLPLLVTRKAIEDCMVASYEIEKDTRVMVNVWGIGRDPQIWDRPLEFAPDRFLKSNIDVKGQDFELLPFGSGRRACPGLSMGLRMVESTLAYLLYAFSWKVTEKGDVNMEEAQGIATKKAEPLIALANPRKLNDG